MVTVLPVLANANNTCLVACACWSALCPVYTTTNDLQTPGDSPKAVVNRFPVSQFVVQVFVSCVTIRAQVLVGLYATFLVLPMYASHQDLKAC